MYVGRADSGCGPHAPTVSYTMGEGTKIGTLPRESSIGPKRDELPPKTALPVVRRRESAWMPKAIGVSSGGNRRPFCGTQACCAWTVGSKPGRGLPALGNMGSLVSHGTPYAVGSWGKARGDRGLIMERGLAMARPPRTTTAPTEATRRSEQKTREDVFRSFGSNTRNRRHL